MFRGHLRWRHDNAVMSLWKLYFILETFWRAPETTTSFLSKPYHSGELFVSCSWNRTCWWKCAEDFLKLKFFFFCCFSSVSWNFISNDDVTSCFGRCSRRRYRAAKRYRELSRCEFGPHRIRLLPHEKNRRIRRATSRFAAELVVHSSQKTFRFHSPRPTWETLRIVRVCEQKMINKVIKQKKNAGEQVAWVWLYHESVTHFTPTQYSSSDRNQFWSFRAKIYRQKSFETDCTEINRLFPVPLLS